MTEKILGYGWCNVCSRNLATILRKNILLPMTISPNKQCVLSNKIGCDWIKGVFGVDTFDHKRDEH